MCDYNQEEGTVNLQSWDWILVSSSGGKDSQAMLDLVVCQAREAGVLDRVVVVHADLGRVEWQGTREIAEAQAKFYGVRFEVVKREQCDLLDHVKQRGMWPSPKQRYCTSDHKRAPIGRVITQLTREAWTRDGSDHLPRKDRPQVRILNCMGLRAQESPSRAKLIAFEKNERTSCGIRSVYDWLPIHHWKVQDVWARIKASGAPVHPAYSLGMPRLSCCFCIFAPRAALITAGKHNRALLDEYVQVEDEIGHRFRMDVSIREVRDAVLANEAVDAAANDAWNM
jgi:3'-phosphoadenosine 5'-phosphosulfate sulfotransferase (PAPS reductase)/FAD synthetase